jgi:hypothetical protein
MKHKEWYVMVLVHFLEDKTIVLSQLLKNIPSVDENIRIKGKKGKVIGVREIEENLVQVHVVFEKVVKKEPMTKDTNKKKK